MSEPSPRALASPAADGAARIWFDVEDLFHFVQRNARPTGIQRVCFEIYRAVMADPAAARRVGFLRHATAERGFVEADWTELEAMFRRVTDRPPQTAPALVRPEPPVPVSAGSAAEPAAAPAFLAAPGRPLPVRLLKRAIVPVPERIRRPSVLFAVMQAQAIAALANAAGLTLAAAGRRGRARVRRLRLPSSLRPGQPGRPARTARPRDPAAPPPPRRLADIARRGDLLVVLGSPWFELDYAELAAFVRGRLGMRLAVLLYDVIPIRRPEWVDRGTTRVFRDWYASVLPLADLVFAISRATAEDATAWCRRDGIALTGPIQPLPLGTGFGMPVPAPEDDVGAAFPPALAGALRGRPYVLFVSTIEARKNHMLLFRVWRRLLEEMGPARVPDLVFAGKVGWLVADLMSQIDNSRHLDGRLHVVEGLDDPALRTVYEGCLFTVFPSFYEGWGLPVSESLAMGKPCLAANVTALPEAGGTLARYFDPFDLNDATRTIRAAIEDPAGLAAWQDEVRRHFRPVGWDRTARALLAALDVRTDVTTAAGAVRSADGP